VLTERVGEGESGPTVLEKPATVPSSCSTPVTEITVQAGPEGIRFLLVSVRPLEEPVAWQGPIVMNTPNELRQAYAELRDGTFIKHR